VGLGVGGWGFGVGGVAPTPHPPIPNPQSPIPNPHFFNFITQILRKIIVLFKIFIKFKNDK